MSKIRVAVIGAGNMGQHHLRNYYEMSNVELVAVADKNPATKKLARKYKIHFYSDYKELLKKEAPQAVSIAVPTSFHFEVAGAAIKAGAHTLIEKPIANNVREAASLIQAASRRKVIFTVGHIERHNPVILKLKHIIETKKLGRISSVICRRVGGFPSIEPPTDVVVDLAIHDIDIMSYLIGQKPKLLSAHGSKTFHSQKIDSAEILLSYNGVSGFVQSNWVTPVKVRNINVTGSEGYVEANYITQKIQFYEHRAILQQGNFQEFVKTLGSPKIHTEQVKVEEPLRNELNSFVRAIVKNDPSKVMDPREALEALRVALAAGRQINKRRI